MVFILDLQVIVKLVASKSAPEAAINFDFALDTFLPTKLSKSFPVAAPVQQVGGHNVHIHRFVPVVDVGVSMCPASLARTQLHFDLVLNLH